MATTRADNNNKQQANICFQLAANVEEAAQINNNNNSRAEANQSNCSSSRQASESTSNMTHHQSHKPPPGNSCNLLLVNLTLCMFLATAAAQLSLANDQHQQPQVFAQRRLIHGRSGESIQQQHPHRSPVSHIAPLETRANSDEQNPAESTRALSNQQQYNANTLNALTQLLRANSQDLDQAQRDSLYWSQEMLGVNQDQVPGSTTFNGEFPMASQQQGQYVAYRPITFDAAGRQVAQPTLPSVNRQLVAPPNYYELGLSPTNALQLEHAEEHKQANIQRSGPRGLVNSFMQPEALESKMQTTNRESESDQSQTSVAAREFNGASHEYHLTKEPSAEDSNNQPDKNSKDQQDSKNSASAESISNSQVDKTIEPRQKRRIFNRILKKAEWNHLFVELSKVFLRYFLDLALKDIIGKQSGSDNTTSRKKLDAQSELADLLKDFVKNAISNI